MDDANIFTIFSIIIMVILVFSIVGFIVNTDYNTVGYDDKDCAYYKYNYHDEQPRKINNCHKICEDYPIWYKWGHDKDCYWDD